MSHFNLDSIIYLNGWKSKHSDNQIKKSIEIIANKDKWILEGFHSKKDTWILPILEKADFVIILNLDKKTLFKRNLKRSIENPFGMYGLMYGWALTLKAFNYKSKILNKDVALIKKYKKIYVIINNKTEVQNMLNKLSNQ